MGKKGAKGITRWAKIIIPAVLVCLLGAILNYIVGVRDNSQLRPKSKEDRTLVLPKIKPYHATAIILMTKDGSLPPTIDDVSSKGSQFFGFQDSSKGLIDESIYAILNKLRDYMNEQDYVEFCADQHALIKKYERGEPLFAQKAIRFNGKHPYREYKNKTFLPVVVSLSDKTKGKSEEVKQEYMVVLYLYRGHAKPLLESVGETQELSDP